MNEIQKLMQRLEAEKEAYLRNANALQQDNREDEASFAKIQANIFGIAAAVCHVAGRQSPENPIAFVQSKLAQLSQEWAKSLADAQQHGDHVKAAIEELKLETVSKITAPMATILEEN